MVTKRRIALVIILAITILAVVASLAPGVGSLAASEPQDPQRWPGTQIYYGAMPQGGGQGLPVLVFVHGFGGLAHGWWSDTYYYGVNDMYQVAYENGYRTAFVTLNSDGEQYPVGTMWANGITLAQQIETIANHYGEETVDIVAHSKGGVDAQTAVVYFGAAQYVRNIFTLGSPHWGSEIADLAYETLIGAWIAWKVGLRGPATYTMTTDYMSKFRLWTDDRTVDDEIDYYWGAGTDHGPKWTIYWYTGRYLEENFGPNDGVVTVASAELPGNNSHPLFPTSVTDDLNHDNIRIGSSVFEYIDSIASAP